MMNNNLILAATFFFALGAADFAYTVLRNIYWDVRDMLRTRRWANQNALRMAELDAAMANTTPTVAV